MLETRTEERRLACNGPVA